MPEYTLTAPLDIRIGDATYHIVAPVAVAPPTTVAPTPPPTTVAPGPVESPDTTRVTLTSQTQRIVDGANNVWTILDGRVALNGAAIPSNGVVELVKSSGRIYQKNNEDAWYGPCSATSGGAAVPGDPTQPVPVTQPPVAGTRRACDIPFASNSVWNIGIGSNARWSGDGDADSQRLRQLRGGITAGAWGMPVFFGRASDPLVTITLADNLYPMNPVRVRVPRGAKPADGSGGMSDLHMTFFDETQPSKLWSFWGCKLNNGSDVTGGISAGLGGEFDAHGDGISVANGNNHNNFFAGTISTYDLAQGVIRHMLRYAISVDATRSPGGNWTENMPWPSTHEDWYGYDVYKGPIVAGCTIGIPASVNLSTLGLSAGGMMLAKALQDYGALWRDSSGTNQINFYSTPENENHTLINGMRNDMGKIVPRLQILRNQSPTSVNGGGSRWVSPLPAIG